MNSSVRFLLVILFAVTVAACGSASSPDDPPEIRYGVDVCTRCGMIISEERYAGGLVRADGETEIFDDIGEMIDVIQEEGVDERRIWVHDYESLEWLDGTLAIYVVSDEIMTPMGSGVVAFEERTDAEGFAAQNDGEVMNWEAIVANWTYAPRGH
jgi:copper chaperone NosL